MAHPVVHFEIIGKDGPALRDFYTQAFDWQMNPIGGPMDYALVQEAGIGGGIGGSPEGNESGHVTFYVQVPDIEAMLKKIERLGGKIVDGPMPLPDGGTIAHFEDTQQHLIGLVQMA
jgi:predicted enzyme related to lactoylglutathione lyase